MRKETQLIELPASFRNILVQVKQKTGVDLTMEKELKIVFDRRSNKFKVEREVYVK